MLSVRELGTLGLMIGARKQLMSVPVMLAVLWPWPCPGWGAMRAVVCEVESLVSHSQSICIQGVYSSLSYCCSQMPGRRGVFD